MLRLFCSVFLGAKLGCSPQRSIGHGSNDGRGMWDFKWIEPQSRWVIRTLFNRDFDGFIEPAKRRVNRAMVLWDLILLYLLAQWF